MDKRFREDLVDLCQAAGGRILFDHPLRKHSTISIGGEAAVWYAPSSLDALKKMMFFLNGSGIGSKVIGNGSNVLIPEGEIDAVFISLSDKSFKDKRIEKNTFYAGAGESLANAISYSSRRGLGALEGLIGIPGTVGGALRMNASYRTAISERLLRVLVLDAKGMEKWVDRRQIVFGYRRSSFEAGDIILGALFELDEKSPDVLKEEMKRYFNEKIEKQPLDRKTLGCIFKNPAGSECTAGELIEKTGMKLFRCGDAQVSQKHANFIVNIGNATSKDVVSLMDEIRRKVREKFSIELEPEIELW